MKVQPLEVVEREVVAFVLLLQTDRSIQEEKMLMTLMELQQIEAGLNSSLEVLVAQELMMALQENQNQDRDLQLLLLRLFDC